MTPSSWPPKLFCLTCGEELPTFDDLEQHTSKMHRQDNKESNRLLRDSLKNR